MAVVEVGKLLGCSAQIDEHSAQSLRVLDARLRTEHSAMIERYGLCRETSARGKVRAYGSGLEKRSRHRAPTPLRVPFVASIAEDLVGVVAKPLAECQAPQRWQWSTGTVSARSRAFSSAFSRLGYDPMPPNVESDRSS